MEKILDLRENFLPTTERETRIGIYKCYLPTGNENKVLLAVHSGVRYVIVDNNPELEKLLHEKGIVSFYLNYRAGQLYLIETIPEKRPTLSAAIMLKKNIIDLKKWLNENPEDCDYKKQLKGYKRELYSLTISTYKRKIKKESKVG